MVGNVERARLFAPESPSDESLDHSDSLVNNLREFSDT